MTEKTYTIKRANGDNVLVTRIDDIWTVPCLWVDDVNCHTGQITVIIESGRLVSQYGSELSIEQGESLTGWGTLDGESLYITNGTWRAAVPADVLAKVAQWAGFSLPANA